MLTSKMIKQNKKKYGDKWLPMVNFNYICIVNQEENRGKKTDKENVKKNKKK